MMASAQYLVDLSLPELMGQMAAQGEPAYRARQIYRQLYHGLVDDFAQMTDLPVALRDKLRQTVLFNPLRLLAEQVSADGQTRKALFALPDGQTVESVLMTYGAGQDQAEDDHGAPGGASRQARRTVCLSTQAGCAMGCAFCATGQGGFSRHLSAGEIISQVLHFARSLRRQNAAAALTNLIYAGMGEPLANYEPVLQSIRRLNDPDGFGLGARHVTISTAGWVPGIQRLAKEPLQVGLAVSLHAPDDATRSRLMPINRKFPIAELLAACRDFAEQTGRRVSYEYILIAGVNAGPEHARRLAALLKGSLSHVNLIPLNPVPGSAWRAPSRAQVLAFERVVSDAGVPVSLRVERGADIQAACGQLRARHAEESGTAPA